MWCRQRGFHGVFYSFGTSAGNLPPNALYRTGLPSSFVCLGPPWSLMHIPFLGRVSPTSTESSFLESDEKKAGAATVGSPCTLSSFHVCLIPWRSCLVGVKRLASPGPLGIYRRCVSWSAFLGGTPYLPKVVPCSTHDCQSFRIKAEISG